MKIWFWRLFWFGLGFALGAAGPTVIYLNRLIDARFDLGKQAVASRVYARPLVLAPGLRISGDLLQIELAEARYRSDVTASSPGSYRRDGRIRGLTVAVWSGRSKPVCQCGQRCDHEQVPA